MKRFIVALMLTAKLFAGDKDKDKDDYKDDYKDHDRGDYVHHPAIPEAKTNGAIIVLSALVCLIIISRKFKK